MFSKFFLGLSLISVSISCANNSVSNVSNLSTVENVVADLTNNTIQCSIGIGDGVINSLRNTLVFIPNLAKYAFFSVTNVTSSIVNRNVLAIQSIYSQEASNQLAEIGFDDRMAREKIINFTVNSPEIIINLAKLTVKELNQKYSGFKNLPSAQQSKIICGVIGSIPVYVLAQEVAIFGATKAVASIGKYSGAYIKRTTDSLPFELNYAEVKKVKPIYDKPFPVANIEKFKSDVSLYASIADGYYNYIRVKKPFYYYLVYSGNCGHASLALLYMLALNGYNKPSLLCATKYNSNDTSSVFALLQYLKSLSLVGSKPIVKTIKRKPARVATVAERAWHVETLNSALSERQMGYVISYIKVDDKIRLGHATLVVKYNGEYYHINNQVANESERIMKFIDWMNSDSGVSEYGKAFLSKSEFLKAEIQFDIYVLDAFYTL